MINISELGIGNIILDKIRSSYVRVAGLLKSTEDHPYISHGINKMVGDVMVLENGDATVLDNVFGFETFYSFVPLTPEKLEKAGLIEEQGKIYLNSSYSLWINPDETCTLYLMSGGYHFIRHLQYLHQLQNLYFYLTETELEIKDL